MGNNKAYIYIALSEHNRSPLISKMISTYLGILSFQSIFQFKKLSSAFNSWETAAVRFVQGHRASEFWELERK